MAVRRIVVVVGLLALAAALWWGLSPRADRAVTGSEIAERPDPAAAPPAELAPHPTPTTPVLAAHPESAPPPTVAPEKDKPGEIAAPSPRRLPLEVVVVDASTGRPLGVPWETTVPQSLGGLAVGVPQGNTAFSLTFDVRVPAHFATWDEPKATATVARRAVRLLHLHPLRPEAEATLAVREVDGSPARDTTVAARVAGKPVGASWESAGSGSGRLVGLPFLPGERVELYVTERALSGLRYGYQARSARWEGRFGDDPRDLLRASVTLPAEGQVGMVIAGTGGKGGVFVGRVELCRPDPQGGRLEVTALARDGRPLAHTLVQVSGVLSWRLTDSRGLATFDQVPPGIHGIGTAEPGVVKAYASAVVQAGETSRVTLREGEGGTVDVEVVDEAGVGLPFATLDVGTPGGVAWCDLSDDGVQRTDPYTDAFGRRTMTHVSPGPLTVSATFGERKGSAQVEVRDGERTPLRVVVK